MPQLSEHELRLSVEPDTLYRGVVYRRNDSLSAWIDQAFAVLARPGESPSEPPVAGDVLVRVALGEPGLGHLAVLSDSVLRARRASDPIGGECERGGPGFYATVVERGAFPHTSADGYARRILDENGRMPVGQMLLRPRAASGFDGAPLWLEPQLAEDEPAEDVPGPIRILIDSGMSENEITNTLFFARHPTVPKQPLRTGSALAREWSTIRDREVRPALKQRLVPGSVDPVLLAIFFSQYEDDPRVPASATQRFLKQPPLVSMGKTLRDRLLSRWRSGEPPLTLRGFYDLAFDVSEHAATAALLCHNVAKSFGRGGNAIHWQATKTEGEYTDGTRTYTAAVVHPAGKLTWFNPAKGREVRSIFYLLFSAKELGTSDPGDWYHYYVTAAMAAFGAAGELTGGAGAGASGRGREAAEGNGRGGPVSQVTQAVYPMLVAERLTDMERQMGDPALLRLGAYRGWVLANALSFIEGGHYGTDQAEVGRESRWHLRGAVFGLQRGGAKPGPRWAWYVPRAGSIGEDELLTGFALGAKTAEVLDPNGRNLSGANPAAKAQGEEAGGSFCERARAEARPHDNASRRLIALLNLPIAAHERTKIVRRARALTTFFESLDAEEKRTLRRRLDDPRDALGRLFECELDRRFRARLRRLLDVAPAAPPAPAPTVTTRSACRRELGSMTPLRPWEREFLALVNNRSEADFRSVAILVGPIILPGLMTEFHRLVVTTALKHGNAITIESNVWFPRAFDTRVAEELAWLVHESVHVLDYAAMGTEAFLQGYVLQAVKVGFSHDQIPHERRANAVEAAAQGLLRRFPELLNVIQSCDDAAISAHLRTRHDDYRAAINEVLSVSAEQR